ncbi:Exocyst complex component EXO84C-like protein [Drosera capensis]
MMESSEDEELFLYHETITPQSKINSLCQSITEKGMRRVCCELLDLKDSVENLFGNTRTKYLAFLRLSEEVVEMEHKLVELRKHVTAQGILVQDLINDLWHELEEWAKADAIVASHDPQNTEPEDQPSNEPDESKRAFLEKQDVLLAELQVEEAVEAIETQEQRYPELRSSVDLPSEASSFRSSLCERKAMLEAQLVGISEQPFVSKDELKKAYKCLLKLGKGPLAHQLLLKRYAHLLQKSIAGFLPKCCYYQRTFPATLSNMVFSSVSMAAKETNSVFGDNPVYTNKIVQWAEQEIESFIKLVRENSAPFETVAALHGASICFNSSVSHCSALESQVLKLSKLLMVLLWRFVDDVLEMNFMRASRATLNYAVDHENLPLSPEFLAALSVSASSSDRVLVDTGVKFIFALQEIMNNLTPLAFMNFGASILGRILELFDKFVDLLIKALPYTSEDETIAELKEVVPVKAETDTQQLSLLGIAYAVADSLPLIVSRTGAALNGSREPRSGVPDVMVSTSSSIDYSDWKRNLQHSLDKLKDRFCQQYVLSFIYSGDGKPRLDARMYIDGEGEDLLWDSHPLPSPPFQDLFKRVQQLVIIAGDVLLGRDKVQQKLLSRLTQTAVAWLAHDQDFWDMFEDQSVTLKPFGLKQLILDLHFTGEIACYTGHSSRQVQQEISAVMAHAIKTFSARGIDPQSILPPHEWLVETAKAAMRELMTCHSGSEALETDDEHLVLDDDSVSDSGDTLSCPSTVDSFHSFVSAEMGDETSPVYLTDSDS